MQQWFPKHWRKIYRRLARIGGLWLLAALLWGMLGAQLSNSPRGDLKNAKLGGDKPYIPNEPESLASTPTGVHIDPFWTSLGMMGFIVASVIAGLMIRRYQEIRQATKENLEKAFVRLDVALANTQLTSEERKMLDELAGSTHPNQILPLLDSFEEFERKVDEFKKRQPDAQTLKHIYLLRQKLGFNFANRRMPFLRTTMLTEGGKLECQIPTPERKVLFMSPILDVTETRILIRPPTIKGKPVNLKKYPYIICKIRRDEEADYEFQAPVLNQISGKLEAIVLGHTKEIRKIFIRESERFTVDLQETFYVITESHLESLGGVLKKHGEKMEPLPGRIVDMSAGGMKVIISNRPALSQGDFLIFSLTEAKLKEEMMAKVVRFMPQGEGYVVNLQFHRLRELARMKINKFLFTVKKRQEQGLPPITSGVTTEATEKTEESSEVPEAVSAENTKPKVSGRAQSLNKTGEVRTVRSAPSTPKTEEALPPMTSPQTKEPTAKAPLARSGGTARPPASSSTLKSQERNALLK